VTRLQRHARYIPLTAAGLSTAILIAVGAAGPSAGVVTIRRDGLWPPWFAHLHLPDLAVAALAVVPAIGSTGMLDYAVFAAVAVVLLAVPLVFLPASRLDWVVLGRSLAGGLAYIPGVVLHLHPAWLQSGFITIITWVAPAGRLLALAALVVLCLTGAWRPARREPTPVPAAPVPARMPEML